jgi:hypothetical protein
MGTNYLNKLRIYGSKDITKKFIYQEKTKHSKMWYLVDFGEQKWLYNLKFIITDKYIDCEFNTDNESALFYVLRIIKLYPNLDIYLDFCDYNDFPFTCGYFYYVNKKVTKKNNFSYTKNNRIRDEYAKTKFPKLWEKYLKILDDIDFEKKIYKSITGSGNNNTFKFGTNIVDLIVTHNKEIVYRHNTLTPERSKKLELFIKEKLEKNGYNVKKKRNHNIFLVKD